MDNNEEHYEVEYVFGKRLDRGNQVDYAVKWLGYDKKHHTWEPISSFSAASLLLIGRFERYLAYKNYYKLIAKKVEKVKQLKKPDEPIRVHIRNRFTQVLIKEAEIINIELDTDEVIQKKETFQIYDDDPDVQIISVSFKPIKQSESKDLNKFKVQKVSQTLDFNRMMHIRQQQFNPIKINTYKSKYKVEKDFLNEIIFEQRQKEKELNMLKFTEINDRYEPTQPIKLISDYSQTEPFLKSQNVYRNQQFQHRVFNYKVPFEFILSHHLIQNELWFKCQSDEQEILFVDLQTLQQNYSTLLLDYLVTFSMMIL
ncbi:unnamed protein product [Paramecium sonneborni]|uniref:Chromo domain-containing protein n=1 Tax=Paramecium sonneborni TaxID=65129 RepID=A0A8S1N0C8_9CILI|nr:unnamed protein product [Paramecium sonneborni]